MVSKEKREARNKNQERLMPGARRKWDFGIRKNRQLWLLEFNSRILKGCSEIDEK